jgi:sulfur relay (sulfurtransferase) DsrC/TusE family protein
MSYDTEIAHTIQQYRKAKLNWNTTIEEILAEPRYARVWEYWRALSYFKRSDYYESFAEVPGLAEGAIIHIMADVKTMYRRENGKWVRIQEMTKRETKSIYGEG